MNNSAAIIQQGKERPHRLLIIHTLVASLVTAMSIVVAAYVELGKLGAEKAVLQLTLPVGCMWLLFTGYVFGSLLRNTIGRNLVQLLAWLLISLLGSNIVGDYGFAYLESKLRVYDPSNDPPLDVVVVLGGGTRSGPARAQTTEGGDRVVFAAELYAQGHVKELITTGGLMYQSRPDIPTGSAQTTEIWTKLGVDASKIYTLDGANTFQELNNLAKWLKEHPRGRVGLLTSAWHLPRAMRLGRDAGLDDLIPVAADHRSRFLAPTILDRIPSADGYARVAVVQKEILAGLVKR